MKRIEFSSPPDGDIILNPDILMLKILFLYVGAEYWSSGSGEGYIEYSENGKDSSLKVLYSSEYGFYLRFQSWGEDFHSVNNLDYSAITKVYVGGDPFESFPYLVTFEIINFQYDCSWPRREQNWRTAQIREFTYIKILHTLPPCISTAIFEIFNLPFLQLLQQGQ